MYLSRLRFHTLPGKIGEAEEALQTLMVMAGHVGGTRPGGLHNHFTSCRGKNFDQGEIYGITEAH
jgi:hypothetical protein